MNNAPKVGTGRAVKATQMPDLADKFSTLQLAKAITAKRTGLKLTLDEVARTLVISKPTLIKIEKGDSNVKLANLLKVMEYLGLSFSVISDDANDISEVNDDGWF